MRNFLLIFQEITLLGDRIADYPTVSQGKTRIPGVNDAEEFEITDVSLLKNNRQSRVYRHFVHAFASSSGTFVFGILCPHFIIV